MAVIYLSFNDFRRDEFKERFRQRLEFTSHFISKSKDFEEEAPVFFNENSDNILLNEKILIFNDQKELIYSTIKDRNVTWDNAMLKELDKKKLFIQKKRFRRFMQHSETSKGKTTIFSPVLLIPTGNQN